MGMRYSLLSTPVWYLDGTRRYGHAGYTAAAEKWASAAIPTTSLAGKNVLITGANAGIGFAAAKALAQQQAEVHMLCRNQERGEAAAAKIREESGNDNVHLHIVDVSRKASVDAFIHEWQASAAPVHAYVHNAGVLPADRVETEDGIELAWATMLWGTHYIPNKLHAYLKQGGADGDPARVVHVGSGGMYAVYFDLQQYNSTSGTYDGTWSYGNAKRAQAELTAVQARAWAGDNISVTCVNPGWVDTPGIRTSLPDFNSGGTLRTPEMGADSIVWLVTAAGASVTPTSGRVVLDREVEPAHTFWGDTKVAPQTQQALVTLCEELTGEPLVQAAGGGAAAR